MNRPRRDIDDLDNLFDRETAAARKIEREQMIESGKRRMEMLDQQDAILRANAKESMLKASDQAIMREYENAKVSPLQLRPDGVPTCSLSLLLRMGWTIESYSGVNVLIAPPPPVKYVAKGECS